MVVYGVIVGITGYVVGYLLTYATAASAVKRAVRGTVPLNDAGAAFAPAWKAVGWVFYDAHLVGTRVPNTSGHIDLVGHSEVQFLYLVPPLLLVVAGGSVAYFTRVKDPKAGVQAGLMIAIGYLPFAIIGAILVSFVGIQPDLLRAAVVAGIVYPVAFGAIGGGLVGVLRADRREIIG
ncbi:MAG: transporter [Halobacteriota archaeon]